MTLKSQILASAAFAKLYSPPLSKIESGMNSGAEIENARLLPLLSVLAEVCEAGADAVAQIKDQRGLWPAEVDTLEDKLEALRKLVGEK